MLETFARFNAGLARAVDMSLSALGITMAVIVALEVFCRYILNHSLFWAEELARYILVWLTFLGATAAYWRKAHPGIDILSAKMRPGLLRTNAVFVHCVSLCLFLVMVYYGIDFSYFVRLQITPALSLPKWIIFAIIPVSGLIFVCHCILFLFQELTGAHRDC
jgi:TRAP-type C4-dicarboxylate transport system permease small subunit